jgi:hypothetical protein
MADFITVALMGVTAFLSIGLRNSVQPQQIALALLYTSSMTGVLQVPFLRPWLCGWGVF